MRASAMATPIYRWLLWIPVLMIAALAYWTVALFLGGMSLVAVTSLSGAEGGAAQADVVAVDPSGGGGVGAPRDGFEPILVRIEESAEPEDVEDNAGSGRADEVAPEPAEAEGEWRFDKSCWHPRW